MSAPALPRRTPGNTMPDDCSGESTACEACRKEHPGGAGGAFCSAAGDIFFAPALPTIEGPPACFECEREPAAFRIGVIQTTSLGGTVGQSFLIGAQCVGPTAAALPVDIDVIITRLVEEPPADLVDRMIAFVRAGVQS